MNNYYTYAYLREDDTPYYIGKGKGKRKCALHKGRNGKIIIKIPTQDRILILKQNLTEEQAFNHEMYMIYVFGRKDLGTGILRNMSDGGEGSSGHKKSLEWKKEQSNRMKENNPMSNPEAIEKMKLSKVGHKQSKETIEKRMKYVRGSKMSEEAKAKISSGNKGKPKSDAHKEALRDAWVRRKEKNNS
jgi:hypothetical protein